MGNCLIAFPNRVDEATLSGGSWAAALPRANLQNRRLSLVARTSDATLASTTFTATFPAVRTFRGFALVNHNLSLIATWRVTVKAAGVTVKTSGWVDVYQMAYDPDLIPWGGAGAWRGVDGDEYIGYDRAAVYIADGFYDGDSIVVEIDDTMNADGYIQIGRAFFGAGVCPTLNMSYSGFGEGYEDGSLISATAVGAEYFDERTPYRVTRLRLDWASELEFQRFYEMQRLLGVTGEVLWVPDVSDAGEQQRRGFLARMRQLSPIEYPYVSTRALALEFKELQP